ncbi:hypothetical protein PBI_INGRID_86 [Arthrobacter phage Ingrid]|nr:hypothetical protein PBI_INGRID_86 [Arthrobacter phage Ingrid]QFG11062.1 hypothetical protein PBI_LORETTA_82 [Arthrobacter phage Loretta]
MTKTVHIVFGTERHCANYARAMAVNPSMVIRATMPEKVQELIKEDVDTIKLIRFPEDIWKPITHPCEKRVKETEALIKGFRRLGITVVEVKE